MKDIIITNSDELKELIADVINEVLDERLPQKIESDSDYYSIAELCVRWQLSRVSVWRYTKIGLLHPIKFGNQVRFSKNEIASIESCDMPFDDTCCHYQSKLEKIIREKKIISSCMNAVNIP